MEQNFLVTIILFFVAMLASGLFAEFVKRKFEKRNVILIGVASLLIGSAFAMPTYKGKGIQQVLFFTVLIFFINFALMLFFPGGGSLKKK